MIRRTPGHPVVSVIIPTRDYAQYLPEAFESVRAQTFADWECVVVDDGSTDETRAILTKWAAEDVRVRFTRQPRRGLSAARNRGLALCRGRYVQFLDADDLLVSTKLERHVEALDRAPEIEIVYGPTRYFDDEDPRRVLRDGLRSDDLGSLRPVSGSGSDVLERLLDANIMTVAAPLVRRSMLGEVGGFDEGLGRLEDWDLWLRCAVAGKRFLFVPSEDPVALIRVHAGSLIDVRTSMLFDDFARMRARLAPSLGPALRARNQRVLLEASAEAGIELGLAGEPRRGLRLLLPRAISARRRRWMIWSLALLIMQLPGGRRLIEALRSRRRRTRASP
jgi:glycosyltransferase involved in cell wall biosynthesis